jgi:alpha-tubulin suppressor-like RCC1 family protein
MGVPDEQFSGVARSEVKPRRASMNHILRHMGSRPSTRACLFLVAALIVSCAGEGPDSLPAEPAATVASAPTASTAPFVQVSMGGLRLCGLRSDGTVACWGGIGTPPSGTFTQIDVGSNHACGVRSSGTVECWGGDSHGEGSPPPDLFLQVSSGYQHTCGLRKDRTVTCWGLSSSPEGEFYQVSAGSSSAGADSPSCGVRIDHTIHCWGMELPGKPVPTGRGFTQVDVGAHHACGLRNSTLECWGDNGDGEASPPTGTIDQFGQGYQFGAGDFYSCAIRAGGTVVCWGEDDYGQASPLSGRFYQISVGSRTACGLRADGTIESWGELWRLQPSEMG